MLLKVQVFWDVMLCLWVKSPKVLKNSSPFQMSELSTQWHSITSHITCIFNTNNIVTYIFLEIFLCNLS